MPSDHLISAEQYCEQHHIELSFISLLHENGLIEITTVEQARFIPEEKLGELEKITRLYHDLDINLEGIEVITHLLARIENLQDEITGLKNRLRLYEGDAD
jgi:chaperone modulatory protein CbpM